MTLKLGQGKYEMSLEHLAKPKRRCAKTETRQKGTEVNLMGSQWPNMGQQRIKIMIAMGYNPS